MQTEDLEKHFIYLDLQMLRTITVYVKSLKVGQIENPSHWASGLSFQAGKTQGFLCYTLSISSCLRENIPMTLSALLVLIFIFFFAILSEWLINKHVRSSRWEWQFIPTLGWIAQDIHCFFFLWLHLQVVLKLTT